MNNYEELFPFLEKLSDIEKDLIEQTTYTETYNKVAKACGIYDDPADAPANESKE